MGSGNDGGRPVALSGGRIVAMDGRQVTRGVLVMAGGRIAAAGTDVRVPPDAEVIHLNDEWILPGFIDAHTHIGTLEDGVGVAGDDHDEATSPVTPQLRVIDAINPADMAFTDAVSGGVLAVGVNPGSCNVIGGQSAALRTVGRTVDEMVLRAPAGIKSALGENPKKAYGDHGHYPSTRMGVAALIRQTLSDAADTAARVAAGERPPPDLGVRVLMQVLAGELPWRQHVHRADDIATALRLADEFGYRLIIDHGTEAGQLADLLAQRHVPVLLGPLIVGRGKVELRNRSFEVAAQLATAGVTLSLITDHPVVPIELARVQAALAVQAGLEHELALRALTVNPATALGVDQLIGTLDAGTDADICVWSGDPLDLSSRLVAAWVRGQRVYG